MINSFVILRMIHNFSYQHEYLRKVHTCDGGWASSGRGRNSTGVKKIFRGQERALDPSLPFPSNPSHLSGLSMQNKWDGFTKGKEKC